MIISGEVWHTPIRVNPHMLYFSKMLYLYVFGL